MYSGISERPITAGAAVAVLRASLPQFIGRKGALYDKMMATHTWGSSYPLERITAMHTFRLMTVLEAMFGNFDINIAPPHRAPCDLPYVVPMRIGC